MNIIGKKYLFFAISGLMIVPGLLSLIFYGLNLSIEFTGGSRLSFVSSKDVTNQQAQDVRKVFEQKNIKVSTIEKSKKNLFIRTQPLDQKKDLEIQNSIKNKFSDFKQVEFETIGPTVGKEITINALKAIVIASILIVLYIAYSFRQVPKPASSIRFGVTAIAALLHDILFLLGMFSIFGHFLGIEIDSLFVTAVLTVIGFSVHDTIVVFDRIRENLRRQGSARFAETVNDSILQTLDRSLNTSLTVVLVLLALLLFGGESIRWFVVALLIGVISGTYSSIFNAAPLLVLWQEIVEKRIKR